MTETFALSVGVLCLSMCFADVVLYVWVDDAFVRRHKKLVRDAPTLGFRCDPRDPVRAVKVPDWLIGE